MEDSAFHPAAGGNLSAPPASKGEESFLQGLVRREDWAFRELVLGYSEKLYRLAYRFLRSEEDAREVLQDVFRRVLEKIDTFKGESKFSTWIYRVTVNESLMRIRFQKGKPTISWEQVLPKYEDGVYIDTNRDWSTLPEGRFLEEEARNYLKECIQLLPEDYRAPYVLKDVEELSEKEVCDILDMDKGVMKIRVHRARMFLRKKLEERYVDSD